MLYNIQAVRDNLRNRDGKRVFYLDKGDQLTSDAKDFLTRERIEVLPASQAKPERYRLLTGGFLEEKPEYMTHLNGDVLVEKTHPRIVFRGALDLLEAELLLCQEKESEPLRGQLGELLDLVRQLIRCDVLEQAVPEGKLWGLTEAELRSRSHRPQDYYGQPHFMPQVTDGTRVLGLNRARCVARQAELAAVQAFRNRDGIPTRPDILRSLNRVSSAIYLLMIQCKVRG